MCQVEEEYHGPLLREELPSVSRQCVKCKEASAAVVIRAGDAYCRGCFKDYFIHKFRAVLGKNRLILPEEKVLLAVSGGPSSCSMLSQVQEGLSQNAHKKLRFLPGIVYIDEGGAVGQSAEHRRRTVEELRAVFRATGLPFLMVPLEQVLDLPSSAVLDGSSGVTAGQQQETPPPEVQEAHTHSLQRLLGSAGTLTAREELLSILRQHLLVHTARSAGYSKLMLGDSCTRLAVKLLSSISLGRGAQLAHDTGFSDSRYGDTILVRPMRDYSAKEIAYYNRMFSVPSVFTAGLDTKHFFTSPPCVDVHAGSCVDVHAGSCVDVHIPPCVDVHTGGDVDVHTGSCVDVHIPPCVDVHTGSCVDVHTGSCVDVHAGSCVDVHAGSCVDVHIPPCVDVHTGGDVDVHTGSCVDVHIPPCVDVHTGSCVDVHTGSCVDVHTGSCVDVHTGSCVDVHTGGDVDVHAGSCVDVHIPPCVDVHTGGDVDVHTGSCVDVHTGGDVDVHTGSCVDVHLRPSGCSVARSPCREPKPALTSAAPSLMF
ncbi:hypothetical protein CgunFtcFv8_016022 [Champsocephalus gunnari]|uniref:Cytoplasmic tRNA 2-thiolation protein 2 n=1 Tax=Champsocephalus gunnari TaxID=52237 RepID=A0AAN8CQ75_CHAGU|nr:hypothetical protein CgunFtcFv8_016022 [Champsocephalus gunnari]